MLITFHMLAASSCHLKPQLTTKFTTASAVSVGLSQVKRKVFENCDLLAKTIILVNTKMLLNLLYVLET